MVQPDPTQRLTDAIARHKAARDANAATAAEIQAEREQARREALEAHSGTDSG